MKPWMLAAALSLVLLAGDVAAATDDSKKGSAEPDTRTLDAVVVNGSQPGPAVWEFSRGRKTIWILGTLQPLPEHAEFNTSEIERRIAKSQAVLGSRGLLIGDNISIFRGLMLWPSIRRVKFNADGRALKDVLPPATYARWLQAKARYIGDDADIERLRPMYAAYSLFEAARKARDLKYESGVDSLVRRAAKQHDVPLIDRSLRLSISDPRRAVREFAVPRAEDIRCLDQTLDHLDGFVRTAQEVGDAWTVGDLARIKALSNEDAVVDGCWAQLTNEAIGRQQGIQDLYAQVDERWLDSLHRALREQDTVFATLPVRDLLDSKGLVAELKREGFQVVPPASPGDIRGFGE
ncbi:uncharacterized protein YbaP (TraB family) [Lysobacter niastensis]|uniref:Uncharacterized protein YbaP (TraB family) n=1 Tax=Lysobacter niastensis TaxID=380629 RepID=A0ABU1W7E0_9GAMM|nr:TraB/GumN family protein [Lysobacter niastensis]MDR7133275.1 uncharacterized protein YbaP (TraB family) [Lysobacter niastensis]